MNSVIKEYLVQAVDQIVPLAVGIRRELHRWPETGNEEYKTIKYIDNALAGMGIPVKKLLETGLVGILEGMGTTRNKTIALRADIDALPIREGIELPYKSERDGFMHACGHDVHTAILLGTAMVLCKMKKYINSTVKFIFQPAEETSGGAERMIASGCLQSPDVDCVYGLHVKPEITAGEIGVQYGVVHASSDTFGIIVKGRSSHCAYPDLGVDALAAACKIADNIQSIISRSVNPLDPAVISIGKFHSGTAVNIIADKAELEGTIRTLNPETREKLRCLIMNTADLTARSCGAEAETVFNKGYDALINNEAEVDAVKKIAEKYLGSDNIVEIKKPSMGVEDFTYYLQKVPGAFFFLGSGYEDRENPPIHNAKFDVNEECIRTGILMMSGLALQNYIRIN